MTEEKRQELKIIRMDTVKREEINWLWYPYIPFGKLTMGNSPNIEVSGAIF